MRGLCAVMVALGHFDFVLGTGVLAKHAWLSVDMFFVLSGFVIALTYEDRLRSAQGFWPFVGTRAARLVPVQILGTVIVAVSLLFVHLYGPLSASGVPLWALATAFVCGLFLIPISLSPAAGVPFYWQHSPFPINPVLWSLLMEWLVNIAYARWLASARTRLLILFWLVIVVCLATHVLLGTRIWDSARTFELVPSLARATVGFLAGVVLYRADRRGVLARLPSTSPGIVFGVWLLICMVPEASRMPVFESVAAVIVAPLSVALLVRGERPLPKIYRELGTLSYPLYASHFAIVHLAMICLPSTRGHNLLFLLLLPAALLLAWGINRLAGVLQTHARRALRSLQAAPVAPAP